MQIKRVPILPHPLSPRVCSQLGVSPSKLFLAAMAFRVHIMQLLAKPSVCKELQLENHSGTGHSRIPSSGLWWLFVIDLLRRRLVRETWPSLHALSIWGTDLHFINASVSPNTERGGLLRQEKPRNCFLASLRFLTSCPVCTDQYS